MIGKFAVSGGGFGGLCRYVMRERPQDLQRLEREGMGADWEETRQPPGREDRGGGRRARPGLQRLAARQGLWRALLERIADRDHTRLLERARERDDGRGRDRERSRDYDDDWSR